MQYDKLSIMVVDDQTLVRSLLMQVLKGQGCVQEHIHQAVDGMSALRMLNVHHFDAVLCDINMEPMGGFDLQKEVRMGRPHVTPSTIPFVFLSGHSERQNVELALQLDADGFIVKPPKPADIEKALTGAFLCARPQADPLRYAHVTTGSDYDRTCGFHLGANGFELTSEEELAELVWHIHSLPVAKVKPDALLMADVRSAEGHLLLRKGKRITAGQLRALNHNPGYSVHALLVADQLHRHTG